VKPKPAAAKKGRAKAKGRATKGQGTRAGRRAQGREAAMPSKRGLRAEDDTKGKYRLCQAIGEGCVTSPFTAAEDHARLGGLGYML
jgi:hypothetical protein